ncbi:MAG TPA: thioredoxin domain-containing protein [Candidatus Paceibacterota bacterium]|jgi:protein-disulfide isomerase|nr:thioredoxin domain-containing protein [Candidatus Paceibacterota bacterium]
MLTTRLRATLDVVTAIVMLAIAGLLLWLVVKTGKTPVGLVADPTLPLVSLDGAPSLGDQSAPYAIVEFSDFECPYCRKFASDVWPEVKTKLIDAGQLRVSFRHLPLTKHPHARTAAEAATCAQRQLKFWPMAEALWRSELADADLRSAAIDVELDIDAFSACRSAVASGIVAHDIELAHTLRVTGTPTFLIGRVVGRGVRVVGVLYGVVPISAFEKAIDAMKRMR